MPAMAKKNSKQNRSPAWVLNLRMDPDLEALVEAYRNSDKREFVPTLTQTFERAIKMLLKEDGIQVKPKTNPEE